jgi:hypothetical protein
MPANPPYIPRKDADLNNWSQNFANLLTLTPALYGQTSGTAAAVQSVVDSWHAAYGLVTSPSTKTAAAVAAKDSAKVTMLASVRPVAINISLNPAVATADKMAIGVNPRTAVPSPITPPTTYPIVTIQAGAALQLYVRYRDSAASTSVKSKPYGVQSVQLKYLISSTPVTDVAMLTQQATLTKSPFLLQFTGGGQCYLAAYYLLKNGKQSGFGPIVSFTVPVAA